MSSTSYEARSDFVALSGQWVPAPLGSSLHMSISKWTLSLMKQHPAFPVTKDRGGEKLSKLIGYMTWYAEVIYSIKFTIY